MSAERWFLDTNVLVYLFDADSPQKQKRAHQVLKSSKARLLLSTQVLQEFYVSVTRKLAQPLEPLVAAHAVAELSALSVRQVTTVLIESAIQRSIRSRLSFWDSLIIETARDGEATVLLSEDMQHGQHFDGLKVENPFRDDSAVVLQ